MSIPLQVFEAPLARRPRVGRGRGFLRAFGRRRVSAARRFAGLATLTSVSLAVALHGVAGTASGNRAAAAVPIDTTPPRVSITRPAEGQTVRGAVRVTA